MIICTAEISKSQITTVNFMAHLTEDFSEDGLDVAWSIYTAENSKAAQAGK